MKRWSVMLLPLMLGFVLGVYIAYAPEKPFVRAEYRVGDVITSNTPRLYADCIANCHIFDKADEQDRIYLPSLSSDWRPQ